MRLLAIDTSGRALSAALAEDGEIIASFGVDEGKNHSLTLLPHLQQLLEEQQLSLAQMDAFAVEQGYRLDFSETRFHHEIYLGDPRRAAPGTLKTVLRHPIREK